MRTKAIIKLGNLKENIISIKERIGDRLICMPVKADAYGHGVLETAKAGIESGAYCLGIADAQEGKELRKGGIKTPILLFSQPDPVEIPEIIKDNLTPFISDIDFASILNEQIETTNRQFAEILGSAAQKIKLQVHLKIDTGMGRMGCMADESLALARHITSCPGLELAGIATHLAVSDSAENNDIDYTNMQLAVFKNSVDAIRAAGLNPGIVHAANSGAVILHPDSWLDMVRPGILLYGYKTVEEEDAPSEHKKKLSGFKQINVKPVMELRSAVTFIKKIKNGESVSYGRTWTADKDTYIAIISAGYADGLPRFASNKWQVIINGKTFPVIGRVCMDQCCVDLQTNNMDSLPDIKRWDEAVIFGDQTKTASGRNGAAALAEITGTIPYEITCNVSKRVPRVYER